MSSVGGGFAPVRSWLPGSEYHADVNAVAGATTIIDPAAVPNGFYLMSLRVAVEVAHLTSGGLKAAVMLATAAPTGIDDGETLVQTFGDAWAAGGVAVGMWVPAGYGLYYWNQSENGGEGFAITANWWAP